MVSENDSSPRRQHDPWNKGRLIGQKRPLKPRDVWTIRVRLQLEGRKRQLALFNLAIDSKLRGCDLVRLQTDDVCVGGRVRDRATVIQKKTGRPVQFEITEQTRAAVQDWLSSLGAGSGQYLFPSRFRTSTTCGSCRGGGAGVDGDNKTSDENLRKPNIAETIEKARAKRAERAELTGDMD